VTAAAAPARPSGIQAWKLAARVPTLTAAVSPVLVGIALAIRDDAFEFGPALAALLGALALQVGANFANDVFDFKKGADTSERLGPPRATQMGLLSAKTMLIGMWAAFGLAFVIGIYLVAVAGWPVVAIGLSSIVAAIVYTGGPWPIGYHALGDAFTFVFFGLVAVGGTYFVQAEEMTGLVIAAAVPVGCTVTMILVVNNLRDIPTDRQAGKTTLGVVMGDRGTRAWYMFLLAAAYVVALGCWVVGSLEWPAVLVLASLPAALAPARAVLGGVAGRALNPVLKSTARFHLAFAVAWSAGILFA
jgi:1,4-dihydroxy-2-naphthoate octaprenyltransferase